MKRPGRRSFTMWQRMDRLQGAQQEVRHRGRGGLAVVCLYPTRFHRQCEDSDEAMSVSDAGLSLEEHRGSHPTAAAYACRPLPIDIRFYGYTFATRDLAISLFRHFAVALSHFLRRGGSRIRRFQRATVRHPVRAFASFSNSMLDTQVPYN